MPENLSQNHAERLPRPDTTRIADGFGIGSKTLPALVLLLLLGAAPVAAAEQFFADSFGKQATANLAPRGARETPLAESPLGQRSAGERTAGLVQPAIVETLDRGSTSVQAVAYISAPGAPPAAGPSDGRSPQSVAEARPAAPPGAEGSSESGSGSAKLPGFPRLAPPGGASRQGSRPSSAGAAGLKSIVTVISSLAVVLGLFCVLAWLMRRAAPGGHAALPSDVFEVLGRASIANRQQVQLLRCGGKLLLVCVTPEGTETLTEIDDSDEVARLAGLCKAAQPGSATAAFRQALQQFAGQPVEAGFAGRPTARSSDPLLPREVEDRNG